MTPKQLAAIHSLLRIRARLRQEDVASEAGIQRRRVVDLEAGRIDQLRWAEIEASFAVLGARVSITASYRGAALERLRDDSHASLLAAVLQVIAACGWETRVEVTFSTGGERGSIDILGWKAAERALLVVEIKSELPGVDPVLRPLDVKVRLAPGIARHRFGWEAESVSRLVVLPEDRTARRLVARHSEVFARALPDRSRDIRHWLKFPKRPLSGLWFLTHGLHEDIARNPSAIRRVQRPRSRLGHAQTRSKTVGKAANLAVVRLIDPHKVLREHT